jgi:hypothetical protein
MREAIAYKKFTKIVPTVCRDIACLLAKIHGVIEWVT